MKQLIPITAVAIALAVVLTMTGCDEDEKVARMAEKAADRQAEQNKEMARVNRELAEGTKLLVEADGESRRELVSLQQDLRADQAEVNEGRDALETERKAIAANRHRDPIIANAVTGVGLTLACLLPLVLCWYLLRNVHDEPNDGVVTEILIEELSSEKPRMLPPFAAERTTIDDGHQSSALPVPADDPDDHQDPPEQRE
jgi:hypothetical protein